MRYLPIGGTHSWNDGWWKDNEHPFAKMMAVRGHYPIRFRDGRPFRWSGALDGLLGSDLDWQAAADALAYFLDSVPFEDRNVIAHSHGGNCALICAASHVSLRTLTTVGTPHRVEVDALLAKKYIGYWQHIYDVKRDLWQWLGQIGPHQLQAERRFLIPGVQNYGLEGISHSKVLRDPAYFHHWDEQGWLTNMQTAAGALAGVGG
jgi:hypothetical protein